MLRIANEHELGITAYFFGWHPYQPTANGHRGKNPMEDFWGMTLGTVLLTWAWV